MISPGVTPAGASDEPAAAASCAGCHPAITEEWSGHAHARAFTDPLYQQALESTARPERCIRCHAPALVQSRLGRMPHARQTARHLTRQRPAPPFGTAAITSCSMRSPGAIG